MKDKSYMSFKILKGYGADYNVKEILVNVPCVTFAQNRFIGQMLEFTVCIYSLNLGVLILDILHKE